MRLSIYRYNPDADAKPYMQNYEIQPQPGDRMLLDILERIRAIDDSLAYRRSCREGICGSDGMNINGRNGLACTTRISEVKEPVVLRPLPSFPAIRDLVVDLSRFFRQYHSVHPYVVDPAPTRPEKERLQTPEQREEINGLYECILCACCSSQCPSYWWNPEKFLGPAALIQACRFIVDSRDKATEARLDQLNDVNKLFRRRVIMNCANVCPKGLNPAAAIERIRQAMLKASL
ncbi:MAG: succinate dehydrogenase iron-sulfur subunit [Pseudomonadota bacterium]